MGAALWSIYQCLQQKTAAQQYRKMLSSSGPPGGSLDASAATAKEGAEDTLPRAFLVLGSSVSRGVGASRPETFGWTARLAEEARGRGLQYVNRGISGSRVDVWNRIVAQQVTASDMRRFGVVILSLSLGNEGLSAKRSPEKIAEVEQHFVQGLRTIVLALRQKMRSEARLIIGGPYPNAKYSNLHCAALQRTLAELQRWKEVDHVIDFLQPAVHDGNGHWHKGSNRDAGHPNDAGHGEMLQCVDRAAVFGPFWNA